MASVAPLRFQRLSWRQRVHAHDGRDVRFLQVGEHQVEYFDVEGQKLRPIEASRAEAVLGRQAYKTEILWVLPVILWASCGLL